MAYVCWLLLLFRRSFVSDSSWLQHTRLPCPSPSPEFAQTHAHWVGDTIQPSRPLSPLLLLPSVFPSTSVFSNELTLHIRWPKYWSFSFNISPSNKYSGLTSFRIDWLDLLVAQGTLKESFLTSQFKSISLLRLCCLYDPTLTSIHDYWKKQLWLYGPLSEKYLCFLICCLGWS